MEYILKVSRKGQIVIPVEVRRKFKIGSKVILKIDNEEIKLVPFIDMKEAFGIDGEKMLEVAKSILRDKERELKLET